MGLFCRVVGNVLLNMAIHPFLVGFNYSNILADLVCNGSKPLCEIYRRVNLNEYASALGKLLISFLLLSLFLSGVISCIIAMHSMLRVIFLVTAWFVADPHHMAMVLRCQSKFFSAQFCAQKLTKSKKFIVFSCT